MGWSAVDSYNMRIKSQAVKGKWVESPPRVKGEKRIRKRCSRQYGLRGGKGRRRERASGRLPSKKTKNSGMRAKKKTGEPADEAREVLCDLAWRGKTMEKTNE